jgi:hypothetical protein
MEEMKMSNITQPEFERPLVSAAGMRSEIARRWDKFSNPEVADLKDKADLVAKVQAKYQLDRSQAQRDVDAFAKGREL